MLSNINLVDLALLDYENESEKARERAILLARRYHEGDHVVHLSERLREFLNLQKGNPFRLNVVRQVVTAVSERLLMASFDTSETTDRNGKKPQAEWAWSVWNANRMDAEESDVHEDTLVDGEHFIIVDWHNGRPRWTPHPRWTGTDVGGDGYGVRMIYPQNDYKADPLFAVKQWTETIRLDDGKRSETRRRRTLYYPDRIIRLVYREGDWKPYIDEGEGKAIIDWTDSRGEPLGIPVVHFINKKLRCEAWDAIPMQDAINKGLVDLLASADMTAFRIYVALGFIPTTDGKEPKADGSNWLKIAPGQVVGTTKSKDQADFIAIDGQSPEPLQNMVHQLVLWLAMVSDTPVSRFITTKQIASADTLKEQDEPLEAKVDHRRSLFGNAWEDCLTISRRLANAFGGANLDAEVTFSAVWQHRRPMEELKTKKTLGVPLEQIWREAGYKPEQIESMKQSDEYQAVVAAGQLAFWQAAEAAVNAGMTIEAYLLDQGWDQQRIRTIYQGLEEQ